MSYNSNTTSIAALFANIYVITMPDKVPAVHAFLREMNVDNATVVHAVTPADLHANVHYRVAGTRSHLNAMCAIARRNSTLPSVVFEDDVDILHPSTLYNDMKHTAHSLPTRWDIVYLSRFHATCDWDLSISEYLRRDSGASGTQAYMVNRKSASDLCWLGDNSLLTAGMMRSHFDMWLKQLVRLHWIDSYASRPMLFSSGVQHGADECLHGTMPWVTPLVYAALAAVAIVTRVGRFTPVLYIVLNWASAVALIVTLKLLLRSWPYPLAASALGFLATLVSIRSVGYASITPRTTVGLSCLMAGMTGLVNMSLHENAVGTYELLKALALPISASIHTTFFKEKETWLSLALVFATFVFIVIGTTVHPYGTTFTGTVSGIAAACTTATYKSFIRHLKHVGRHDPVQVLNTILPCATVMLLAVSAGTEHTRWLIDDWYEWCLILIMCILVVVVASTAHIVVGHFGPTSYLCLAALKTMTVISLFDSWGAPVNTVGIVGAAACAPLYVLSKHLRPAEFKKLAAHDSTEVPSSTNAC